MEKAKKCMLLINPNAGKSGYKSELGQILNILCTGGRQPTVYFTRGPGDAAELVRAYGPDYEEVICMGGDGTLSEVCAGMLRIDGERLPIGYIPLGTTNDVARTLGLSPRPAQATRNILKARPFSYDIGHFGEKDYFTYVAAFGAFTEVSYETPQETKQALGHLAYMLEGLRKLSKISVCHAVVDYDGGTLEDDFVFGAVTNSTSVAGLVRLGATQVDLSDGMFEVLLVRNPRDLLALSDIITSLLNADFSGQNVLFLKSSRVHFHFREPVAWTRDGEDGGKHLDVTIFNCHPGVEILV